MQRRKFLAWPLLLAGQAPAQKQQPRSREPVTGERIASKTKAIIVKLLRVDAAKVRDDADLEKDLHADSLDVVEIIMALEDEFGIEIPDDDAEKIHKVGELVAYLKRRLLPKSRPNAAEKK